MTETTMLLAVIGPLATIAAAAWRISSLISRVEHRLDSLERENRQLRSDVLALQTLLRLFVDPRRDE